jgi:hypothetical protein
MTVRSTLSTMAAAGAAAALMLLLVSVPQAEAGREAAHIEVAANPGK